MNRRKILGGFPAAVLAAVTMALFPGEAHAQKPVTDMAATTQRAAQHAENLENWLSEMANWEAQLKTALESTEWLSKTYNALKFLGGSQQLLELINEIDRYRTLVGSVTSDIENYSQNGLMSFSQLQYSMSLVNQGLRYVTGTLSENMLDALTSSGMTVAERFSLLCGTSETLKREYWKLLLLKKQNTEKAAAISRATDRRIISSMTMPSLEPPLSEIEGNIEVVLKDPFTERLYAEAMSKQSRYFSGGDVAERTASEGRTHQNNFITLASYLIGIAAALLLAIAFERRNKGDHQSHDALYKIGIGLLFALIALQIVSKYFMF